MTFFSRIGRVGAGDPVFGTLPAHIKLSQCVANGLATDLAWRDPFGIGDFGDQVEGPEAGRLAKGARALVEQGAQLLASGRVEDSVRKPLWGRGAWREDGKTLGIEAMNDVADSLVVAGKALGNQAGMLAAGASEQDLAAAQDKGVRGAQAGINRLLFGSGEGPHKDRSSHAGEGTIFPTTLLETALDEEEQS